jgi:hypothetical protein
MVDMLSYETCKQLAACGFPQSKCGTPGVVDNPCTYGGRNPDGTNQYHACPNSDELLAAMQARWPLTKAHAACVLARIEGEWQVSWWRNGRYMRGTGDTPAAALAALYIKLAKELTHD